MRALIPLTVAALSLSFFPACVGAVGTPGAPSVAVMPPVASSPTGGTLSFSAVFQGALPGQSSAVSWSVLEPGGGRVDSAGHYTAPATPGTYHVVAVSVADTSVQASATVTVISSGITVAVAPKNASTTPGGTVSFSATVSGGQSGAVTWSVQEAGGGSVDGSGKYVAPAATGTFHVVAASVEDVFQQDVAEVVVSPVPVVAVAIAPRSASLVTGGTLTFTATVTGTTGGQSTAVTWSVQEAGGGTVNTAGRYTAPATTGTFHVVAASVADPSKKATATVTVGATPVIAVSISPDTGVTTVGGTLQFTATVTGTTTGQSTAVTWSVQEAGGGTVSGSGLYTAPSTAGTYHLLATSVADTSKQDSVVVTVNPRIAVSISPTTAAAQSGGTVTFTATVTGTASGQSTAVNWSVVEAGGGSVSSAGVYTAPAAGGTFHVKATSAADPTKSAQATVTVTAPVAVSISPATATFQPGSTQQFTATVTGTANTAVTWSVQESGGGTVTASGLYTAPSATGTYHVLATSQADPTKRATATVSVVSLTVLPADRSTVWNPGVTGGIPARTTVCATVNPPAGDATSAIQAAIDACPAGQVVKLGAGAFTINGGNFLLLNKGITLRGAGPGQTILQKTDGAKPGQEATGANPSPIAIVGPARWDNNGGSATNLTADGVKGTSSVTVASASGFSAGQIVLLDELSGAGWQTDPAGRGQIWASPDFRVVWQRHNPPQGTDDPFPDAFSWFMRTDRPTNEIKKVDHVSGNTVFFTTPIHITYRSSHTAQLSTFGYPQTENAGIEDLTVIGGDQGNIRFQWAANCWAKNVENTVWHDEGFAVENSFKIEIRESYVHDAAWAQPGGAGYAISFANGASEVLVENSIIFKANKVMVARASGAGSVFGYNYADDGYINTNTNWIEIGLNASHMVGPHHVLFEGNYGFNWDSDKTHGNAILHTVFRNHLRGVRRDFGDDAASNGPKRCAGATYYSYWHSFIGNVLGAPGAMSGWVYESGSIDQPSIYKFGWDDWAPYPVDPNVAATTIRHGNFDYVTNSVVWDPANADHTLPNSLYLASKPAFFNAGSGYTWPWVDPLGTTQLYTLPAKARFDAGTPFVHP